MLINFRFSNYRSFKDENEISMEARGINEYKDCLIDYGRKKLLPAIAVYGKNGGGKSNFIRAFWLGVKFICNAQKTQHENSEIPVRPFLLDDTSKDNPTSFDYSYIDNGIKYQYGFSATRKEITKEYLYHSPKGQKATIFYRKKQEFYFPDNSEKQLKELIKNAVSTNQLFFSIACTMNYGPCIAAMNWFRNKVFFTRDYNDISRLIIENSENKHILDAILTYAKKADVGIEDMKFEVRNMPLNLKSSPQNVPDNLKSILENFVNALEASPNSSEVRLQHGELNVTSLHKGIDKDEKRRLYPLDISDESDGTHRLMALSPAIVKTLKNGGTLVADELETRLHPLLIENLIAQFQSKKSNPNNAQIIFTTHDTNLFNLEVLRRDQFAFVDKDEDTGASELYGIDNMQPCTSSNAEKSYLIGKFGAIPNLDLGEV